MSRERPLELVLEALRSPDPQIRAAAMLSVEQSDDPGLVPALEALLDQPGARRSVLLSLLATLRGRREQVRQAEDHAQEQTERALGQAGAVCRAVLLDSRVSETATATALSSSTSEGLQRALRHALEQQPAELRAAATRSLGRGEAADSQRSDPAERVALACVVATTLGELGSPSVIPALMVLLGDADGPVRAAAAKGLEALGQSRWAMRVWGDDEDWDRLGKSRDERSLAPLMLGAKQGVLGAIYTLGEYEVREARGLLRGLLSRDDPQVQRAAALALVALKSTEAVEVLEERGATAALALLADDITLGEEAVGALAEAGAPEAREAALRALYGHLRRRTCVAMDELEALFFAPLRRYNLEGTLSQLRAPRMAAMECLWDLGERDALVDALVDRDSKIRGRAAEVLTAMGEPRWAPLILGRGGDLRRLAESKEPERLRLLVLARKLNAELPKEARALLVSSQSGAISLDGRAAAGGISLSDAEAGALSLDPHEP